MEDLFFGVSLGGLSKFPQLLIEQRPLGMDDTSELLALLHTGETVPQFNTVPEYQEYIAKIGQDAQLAVLFSPHADMKLVDTIGQTVTLANQEMLYHPELMDQETGKAKLHKYTEEIQKSIRWLVIQSNIKSPVFGA